MDGKTLKTQIVCSPLEKVGLEHSSYSLVVSNVPFGDVRVFDRDYFENEKERTADQNSAITFAQRSLHNYFAVKSMDLAEDNGIVAFITTGGFANSPSNRIVRNHLLQQSELVSAVRFPDTLFREEANTEAPSDLFIFRKFPGGKRPENKGFTEKENRFIVSERKDGIYWNSYFLANAGHIIHSEITAGTDQYGKPNLEVRFGGGTEDIARELNGILQKDIAAYLSLTAYYANISMKNDINMANFDIERTSPAGRPDTNDLYELHFRAVKKKIRKTGAAKAATQITEKAIDLFSLPKEPFVPEQRPADDQENVRTAPKTEKDRYSADRIAAIPSFRDGMLHFDENGSGFSQLWKDKTSGTVEVRPIDILRHAEENTSINAKTFDRDRAKGLLGIRNAYNLLYDTEYSTQTEQPELRTELNGVYDRYVSKYGLINTPMNRRYAGLDEHFEHDLVGIELPVPNLGSATVDYVKSSIFGKTVNIRLNEHIVSDERSALVYSINTFGHVDMGAMSQKSGISETRLEDKLADHILFNPATKKHELRSTYLNTNLYARLGEFRDAVRKNLDERERLRYRSQLAHTETAIRESIPAIVPFGDIDIALGERWIPTEIYAGFAHDLFQTPVKIQYLSAQDEFRAAPVGNSYEMDTFYSAHTLAGKKSATNLLESALLDETLVVRYKDPVTDSMLVDNNGTVVCNEIVQRIRSRFTEWLREPKNENIRQELTDLYNHKFNGIAVQQFDGSLLALDDVNWTNLGIPEAYRSQRDSLMMLLCNQGGIVDHVPGGGKTLIECMAAHYMKKMGVAKKSIIIGLKANLDDLVSAYKKAFPQDRIIAPTTRDFEARNRMRLFNQIKNNDWDCIFLTHNQFEKIPVDPNVEVGIIRDELRDLRLNLESVARHSGDISIRSRKGLEKQISNLESRLEEKIAKINRKKDDLAHFGQLGIDHIIVDESHMFKNLSYSTRHSRIGGLGNPEGSQRAFNLMCALRNLQGKSGKDLQASFFSGTPISNSLTEMYLLFKYMTPNDLKSKQIVNFDSWASVFARKSSELELSLTNQLVVRERFREFTKVPELARDYRRITDYRNAEDIGLKRPPIRDELIVSSPTEAQMDIFRDMQQFMETGRSDMFDFASNGDNLFKAKGLIAANICTKACLDVRFVLPEEKFQPNGKEHLLVEAVSKFHSNPAYSLDKATQLIFLDQGVPGGGTFNLYQDIKDRLVGKGISPDEIAFIHDYDSQHKKPVLNQKMKDGSIRILIGGTEKLGTGWNIQHRIIAMHHYNIPWKPSEMEQRIGRGQRTGNRVAEKHNGVHNLYYVVENSPEVAKVDMLRRKAAFINQMKTGDVTVRRIDEGTMDESLGISYSDIVMQTSGDGRYKERNRIENLIGKMEVEKGSFQGIATSNSRRKEALERIIPSHMANIESLSRDLADYAPNVRHSEKGGHKGEIINETKITGRHFATEELLGKHLISLSKTEMRDGEREIGSLYGFAITMQRNSIYTDDHRKEVCNTFQIHRNGKPITFGGGIISEESPKRAARHFYYALNRIDALIEREQNAMRKAERELEKVSRHTDVRYPKEKELAGLKAQLAKLTGEIKRDIGGKKEPVVAAERKAKGVRVGL